MPEVPAGLDAARFAEGWLAGRKVAADEKPVANPIAAGTPEARAWDVGYYHGLGAGLRRG
jgi:hypothetical protein